MIILFVRLIWITKNEKMKKITLFFTIFTLFFLCFSCDPNRVYLEYEKIDNYIWDEKDIIEFQFDIDDTTSLHNLYVLVRHSGHYPFNNLWLFITSTSPAGISSTDTINCIFADNSGKWLGDGSGDLWDNKILWKQLVRFPRSGTYTVEYQHGMRLEQLPAILDVGLRIETIED